MLSWLLLCAKVGTADGMQIQEMPMLSCLTLLCSTCCASTGHLPPCHAGDTCIARRGASAQHAAATADIRGAGLHTTKVWPHVAHPSARQVQAVQAARCNISWRVQAAGAQAGIIISRCLQISACVSNDASQIFNAFQSNIRTMWPMCMCYNTVVSVCESGTDLVCRASWHQL